MRGNMQMQLVVSSQSSKIAANVPASNWATTNILPHMGDIDHNVALMVEKLTTEIMTSRASIEQLNAFVEKRAALLEVPASR